MSAGAAVRDITVQPPRSYASWDALLAGAPTCDERLAQALAAASVEPGAGPRVFGLVQAYVEERTNRERRRYVALLDEAGADVDAMVLATARFCAALRRLGFFAQVEGLPEEACRELAQELAAYAVQVLRMVRESLDDVPELVVVLRREERRWQAGE